MALARACTKSTSLNMPKLFSCVHKSGNHKIHLSASAFNSEKRHDHDLAVQKNEQLNSSTDSDSSHRSVQRRNPFTLLPFRPKNIGLGSFSNALSQASHNLTNILGKFSPTRLFGKVKEKEDYYKLRFEVPGLTKNDIKITIEDGYLVINGEQKEEEEGYEDGDEWYLGKYGCYYTSLMLPDDAKVEEIKAEVKNGVLYVTVPRSKEVKKNVRQVEIE